MRELYKGKSREISCGFEALREFPMRKLRIQPYSSAFRGKGFDFLRVFNGSLYPGRQIQARIELKIEFFQLSESNGRIEP